MTDLEFRINHRVTVASRYVPNTMFVLTLLGCREDDNNRFHWMVDDRDITV